jgi:uncharacterized protein with von Willebrand factor type A (vWA) domain
MTMDENIKKYLSKIGQKGGMRSRRVLDSATARQMVRLREARRAFKQFYTECFWSSPQDYQVKKEDIAWVAQQIMTHGGREGWKVGEKLCP